MDGIVWPRMGNAMDSASLLTCLIGPLWHACSGPSVMPAGSPLSCLLGPLWHARSAPSVIPAGC